MTHCIFRAFVAMSATLLVNQMLHSKTLRSKDYPSYQATVDAAVAGDAVVFEGNKTESIVVPNRLKTFNFLVERPTGHSMPMLKIVPSCGIQEATNKNQES